MLVVAHDSLGVGSFLHTQCTNQIRFGDQFGISMISECHQLPAPDWNVREVSDGRDLRGLPKTPSWILRLWYWETLHHHVYIKRELWCCEFWLAADGNCQSLKALRPRSMLLNPRSTSSESSVPCVWVSAEVSMPCWVLARILQMFSAPCPRASSRQEALCLSCRSSGMSGIGEAVCLGLNTSSKPWSTCMPCLIRPDEKIFKLELSPRPWNPKLRRE